MSFLEEYKQKLVSADEAVKIVKSGDWVDYGWCTGTPDALDKALARRTDELKDVNVRGGILLKPLAIFEREDAGEHVRQGALSAAGVPGNDGQLAFLQADIQRVDGREEALSPAGSGEFFRESRCLDDHVIPLP